MSKRNIVILTIAVLIIGSLAYGQVQKSRQAIDVDTVKVVKTDLGQTVSGSGVTEAAIDAGLNFMSSGRMDTVYVSEGQKVSKDELLAELDTSIMRLQRKQQQAVLSEASAAYEKLRNGLSDEEITIAEIAVRSAERSLAEAQQKADIDLQSSNTTLVNAKNSRDFALSEREEALAEYEKLVKKYEHPVYHIPNYTPSQQAEVDAAKATADTAYSVYLTAENAYKAAQKAYDQVSQAADISKQTAEDQLESARAQLALKSAPLRREDSKAAKARITQASAQLEIIDQQIDDATLKAPFDGLIVSVNAKEGEFVTAGSGGAPGLDGASGVIVMSDPSTIRAKIDVDEADITRVKPGQKAVAFLDAYKDAEFSAKVIRIGDASVKTEGGGTAFPVYIEIKAKGKKLWQGMNVDVDITVQTMAGVISVPAEAVTTLEGRDIVYVVENSRAKAKQVKVGTSTDTRTEIISGIKEGDTVITSNISKVKDGSRIKI